MTRLDVSQILDREAEAAIFNSLLQFGTQRRVLVVDDGPGRGKTELLRKLRHLCEWKHNVPVALVDFKEKKVTEEWEIVQTLGKQLQIKSGFPQFDALDEGRSYGDSTRFLASCDKVKGTVNLTGAQVSGNAIVAGTVFKIDWAQHVSLNQWTDEAERHARALCAEAFFDDLGSYSASKPVVLLMDAVDVADEEITRWVLLDLLRRRLLDEKWVDGRLILVIAGVGLGKLLDNLTNHEKQYLEPAGTLRDWDDTDVAAFLELHGCKGLSAADIAFVRELIARGKSLTTARTIAEYL